MKNEQKHSFYFFFFSYDRFCPKKCKCFGSFFGLKKNAKCPDRSFCIHEFFFTDFQLLSYGRFCILQLLTVFALTENLVGFIAKYAVDANLFRLGSSILKHAGSKSTLQIWPLLKKIAFLWATFGRLRRPNAL